MPRAGNCDEALVGAEGLRRKARVRGHDAILGALLGAGRRRGSHRYPRHHPSLPTDIRCLMAGGFYIEIHVTAEKPPSGLEIFGRAPDFTAANVMLWSDEPMVAIDARTVLLGYLFRKGRPSVRVRDWAGVDGSALVAANGRELINGYWGGYVFVHVAEDGALYVLRDPSGLLPCYIRRSGCATALAGDVTDLVVPEPGRIDFEEIGRILASGDARGRNTCLVGVEELIAGECLVVDRRSARIKRWWSPWDHVTPRGMSFEEETNQLRQTITDCIGSALPNPTRTPFRARSGCKQTLIQTDKARLGAGGRLRRPEL